MQYSDNEFTPVSDDGFIPVMQDSEDTHCLECPVCGTDGVHPIGVDCFSPGSRKGHVHIDSDGIVIDTDHRQEDDGVLIKLSFHCEEGHVFQYGLVFYHGVTSVARVLNQIPVVPEGGPRTIWRAHG